MNSNSHTTHTAIQCYHCGDDIRGEKVEHDGKLFCCSGCKVVYEILEQNNLCQYYTLEQAPGNVPPPIASARFDFLDDESMQKQLLQFSDHKRASLILTLPSIHCSSCIWLLEHLYRLDMGITSSRVDFLKKQISLTYDPNKTSLKNIVVLLASIGYEPDLSLDSTERKPTSNITRSLYYKIGIAGFCFGNAMLFSFPEYLGVDESEQTLREIFNYLNLLLGVPVFFYCSADYFSSAWNGLKKQIINIDVPIALGIVILFSRSVYEILTNTGAGFIDSLCGLLFFLLLGRVFQSKTYDSMNFERNYKSYFPLSVITKKNGVETTIPISSLTKAKRIVIRNNEIIPADSMLLWGNAMIDYSFVTGESTPVEKVLGEIIYAGGRQVGGTIELDVIKEVSQSYLTQLWSNFKHKDEGKEYVFNNESGKQLSEISNTISKYFTIAVLVIASLVALYWIRIDVKTAINAFTGILIVACPCAMAISIPFTLGTTMRIFGRNNFYLKNASVVESLAKVDAIVFDKTGTITHPQKSSVEFVGVNTTRQESVSYLRKQVSTKMDSRLRGNDNISSVEKYLNSDEINAVYSLAKNSIHPLSKIVSEWIHAEQVTISDFSEQTGKGVSGTTHGLTIKFGSQAFAGSLNSDSNALNESRVYLTINGLERGYFSIRNVYREGLKSVVDNVHDRYELSVVSGDNESERIRLYDIFPKSTGFKFNQMPSDKMDVVKYFQSENKKVMMVGDGLNDAGALMQSDVGIAVAEDVAQFTPSSDAILAGSSFNLLPTFLSFSKTSINIVIGSFLFAFMYNLIALFFAIQGQLSPIIAAILMPASSITIVVLTTVSTQVLAKRKGLL